MEPHSVILTLAVSLVGLLAELLHVNAVAYLIAASRIFALCRSEGAREPGQMNGL